MGQDVEAMRRELSVFSSPQYAISAHLVVFVETVQHQELPVACHSFQES